jgi:hypothetical protein
MKRDLVVMQHLTQVDGSAHEAHGTDTGQQLAAPASASSPVYICAPQHLQIVKVPHG